jgi:hypothetical protein
MAGRVTLNPFVPLAVRGTMVTFRACMQTATNAGGWTVLLRW